MVSPTSVLMTGANTGTGFEPSRSYIESNIPNKIILAGRSVDKVPAAIETLTSDATKSPSTITPLQLGACDDNSIAAPFATIDKGRRSHK